LAGAETILQQLSMRYSKIAVPKSLALQLQKKQEGSNQQQLKKANHQENTIQRKTFEAERPIILGVLMDKDECIAEATDRETIAKGDIQMDNIKILVLGVIKKLTAFEW
jgi:hypothetical protein